MKLHFIHILLPFLLCVSLYAQETAPFGSVENITSQDEPVTKTNEGGANAIDSSAATPAAETNTVEGGVNNPEDVHTSLGEANSSQPALDGHTQPTESVPAQPIPTGAAETPMPAAGVVDGQENPRAVDSAVQPNTAPVDVVPVQPSVDAQTTTNETLSNESSEPLQNQNTAQPETVGVNNNPKAQTNVSVADSSLGFGLEPFALYGFFAPKGDFGTRYKSGDLFAGGINVPRYSLFGVSSFVAFSYSSIETKHDARYVDAKMTLSAFLFGLNGEFKRPLFSVIRIHRWMGDQYYVGLRASAGVTRVSFTSDTHATPLTDTVATYNGTLCAGIEYFFGLRAGVFGGYQYIATAGTPLTGVFAGAEVGWRF